MTKALFSNPPWWDGQESGLWRGGVRAGSRWPFTLLLRSTPDHFCFGDYLPYPFFLGYAATYVRANTDASVTFRDSIALRESYDSWLSFLAAERFDYIFIETATPSWHHDASLLETIHRVQPDAKIVVCGPITTIKSDEILASLPVHACIKGEYEKGAARVIRGESGVIDFDLLTVEEMNTAPFPWYDETIAHRYWDVNPLGQLPPHAHVWSSRGCPYKCIFCVWPAAMTGNDPDGTGRRTVRHYSPDYMEAFIRELITKYHFRSIYFDDDTFNLGNRHVVDMCRMLKRIGVPWSAMCRADTSKMETWALMHESGCFGVKIGFESGNQYVVDKIVNKHLDLGYASNVVHELKRLGMTVHGTFTFGLPGETPQQMNDTLQFIRSLPFDSVQTSGTAEIEGTPLHTLRLKGRLPKYEGAAVDTDSEVWTDGNKRWAALAEKLRDS
jgi:radical SAM superfamily enzyme YgiQ (UPF0313 family)